MIEELDKLPAADLFSRWEENVPGICNPNQPESVWVNNLFCHWRMQSCMAGEI